MALLRLKNLDGTENALETQEVRKRFDAGEVSRSTMSWATGEPGWISLGRRWPNRQSSFLSNASAILASWLGILVAGTLTFGDVELLPDSWQGFWSTTVLALLVLTSAVAVVVWAWRRSARIAQRRSVGLVASGLLLGLTAVSVLPMISIKYDVERHRTAGELASITVDDTGTTIMLEGEIDGGARERLRDVLQQHRMVKMLVVDSAGGFVDEAMAVADIVREHGLIVRIDGHCYSACVVIWASAPRREITIGSTIGLHQSRNEISLPGSWKEAARTDYDSQYDSRLRAGGFPIAMLAKGRETPPEEMHLVTAIELAQAQIPLTIIDRHGRSMSLPYAQIVDAVADLDPDHPIMLLIEQLAHRDPGMLEAFSPRFVAAKETGDADAANVLGREIAGLGKAYALKNATDQTVLRWIHGLLRLHREALTSGDDVTCGLLASKPTSGTTTEKETALSKAVVQQMVDVISTIPNPPPGNTRSRSLIAGKVFDEAVMNAYHARVDEGASQNVAEWGGVEHCRFTIHLYEQVLAHSPAIAAEAIRVAELEQ